MESLRSYFAMALEHVSAVPYRIEVWFFTRPLWPLLWSLPAITLAGSVLAVVAFQSIGPKTLLIARYQVALDGAYAENDWASAGLFALKLTELENTSDKGRFALACLAEKEGDLKLAERLMAELAPDDGPGHPPAHFWMVRKLLRDKQRWKADESDILIHHLEQSLESQRTEHQEMAGLLLVDIYAARREYNDAVRCLKSLVGRRPDLQLKLAELYRALGDEHEFQSELKNANQYFREQLDTDPTDAESRLLLARTESLDGDFQEAEAVLLAGLSNADDPRLRTALSELCILMADQLRQSNGSDLGAQLELLQKALDYEPGNASVLGRFGEFIRLPGPEAEAARMVLHDALANGDAPPIVHLVLGTLAASEGRLDEAQLHLKQANELAPQTPELLNNLAWVVAHAQPPDLEQALRLINAALELSPNHPEMRETRGQILVSLEQWQDALIDLEYALGSLRGRPKLHATLAHIYAQLGDEDMAALHRQRAERPPPEKTTGDEPASE